MKIALITSIFGGVDLVKEIPVQSVEFSHHHFSEYNTLDRYTKDRLKSLYYKLQHHKEVEADLYIYIDGKIQITCYDFIEQMINQLGENDLAIMKHLYRQCVYEEVDHIEYCIRHGNEYLKIRYSNKPLRQEVEMYRRAGYPENNGLNDCCIFIHRNNEKVNAVFDDWWSRVLNLDAFDQTAIQFVAWGHGIQIIPLIFKPCSFIDVPHIKMQ